MKNFSIRKAVWEDLSNIKEIKKEAHGLYVNERPDIYQESELLYTEHFLKSFFKNGQKVILVALFEKEVVGYGFIECINVQLPMMIERQYAYIHDFAVSEKFRRQGIATRLLSSITEYARENGASRIELAVHLFSREAIAFYEKSGFYPRAIRMEKELDDKSSVQMHSEAPAEKKR